MSKQRHSKLHVSKGGCYLIFYDTVTPHPCIYLLYHVINELRDSLIARASSLAELTRRGHMTYAIFLTCAPIIHEYQSVGSEMTGSRDI